MHSGTTQREHEREVKFDFMSIKAGDIIFVLPESSGLSKLVQLTNVHGQHLLAKVRRRNRMGLKASVRKYSHVMLGAGDGLIIHADGKKVALEVVTDALRFGSTKYQVFRRADLPAAATDHIARAGIRYMQQKYSFMKYFGKARENDTTQFCSRLVAHAYRSAGLPMSAAPDKDVLPLDLYLLCQTAPWSDVTAETILQPLSQDAAIFAHDIEVPGKGVMSMADFFANSDKLLLGSLHFQKQFQEILYKNYRDILQMEALLAKYCLAMFKLAKQTRASPDLIDDAFSEKIASVLRQIETLLDLAALPDIDLLVENTLVNTDTGGAGESTFVGIPRPIAIREMQTSRESIRIYTYLLMAETGLLSILAHVVPHDKFDAFKVVKTEYVNAFLAALPQISRLEDYGDVESPFAWVDKEADRTICQQTYKNLIGSLGILKIATGNSKPSSDL
jgi:hypothetical protein